MEKGYGDANDTLDSWKGMSEARRGAWKIPVSKETFAKNVFSKVPMTILYSHFHDQTKEEVSFGFHTVPLVRNDDLIRFRNFGNTLRERKSAVARKVWRFFLFAIKSMDKAASMYNLLEYSLLKARNILYYKYEYRTSLYAASNDKRESAGSSKMKEFHE